VPELDTFENAYPDRDYEIRISRDDIDRRYREFVEFVSF